MKKVKNNEDSSGEEYSGEKITGEHDKKKFYSHSSLQNAHYEIFLTYVSNF
jgi:hypothetical protein